MRPFVIALSALLLAAPVVAYTTLAASPVHADKSPHSAMPPPRPLLWKVSGRDSHVYLLGSFHLLKKDDYPLSADVDHALADAESLAFEIAPEALSDPQLPMRMARLGMGDAKTSLPATVSPEVLVRLHARMKALGLPADQLDRFKPWFVDVALVSALAKTLGFSPDDGLDRVLMARAKQLGKPATGLETVEAQLAALDSTPASEQVVSLNEITDPHENVKARLDELHGAWRNGDIAMIERLMRDDMQIKTPQTYRLIDVERNRAWLPKLETMLHAPAQHDTLVVVGALHLIGSNGLVQQLKARGYRVERICSACASPARGASAAPKR